MEVKWAERSPSTRTIRVRIFSKSTLCFKRTRMNKKGQQWSIQNFYRKVVIKKKEAVNASCTKKSHSQYFVLLTSVPSLKTKDI